MAYAGCSGPAAGSTTRASAQPYDASGRRDVAVDGQVVGVGRQVGLALLALMEQRHDGGGRVAVEQGPVVAAAALTEARAALVDGEPRRDDEVTRGEGVGAEPPLSLLGVGCVAA